MCNSRCNSNRNNKFCCHWPAFIFFLTYGHMGPLTQKGLCFSVLSWKLWSVCDLKTLYTVLPQSPDWTTYFLKNGVHRALRYIFCHLVCVSQVLTNQEQRVYKQRGIKKAVQGSALTYTTGCLTQHSEWFCYVLSQLNMALFCAIRNTTAKSNMAAIM